MNKKPLRFSILVVLLFLMVLAHLLFLKVELYFYVEWLDMPMHFLVGSLLGLIGICFLSSCFNIRQKIPIVLVLTASLITALTIGGIWEIVEFHSETILRFKLAETIASEDTRGDLFFDFLGALVGATYFILMKDRTGRRSSPRVIGKNQKT